MSRKKFDIRYRDLLENGFQSIDISNKDLDNIIFTGAYHGFNIINSPDENYTEILVTKHSSSWIVQEAKTYLEKTFLRSFKDGFWNKWTELVTKFDCDNPDKEIIIIEKPHSHGVATHEIDGFMSYQDKKKLDSIDVNQDGSLSISPEEHFHQDYENAIDELKTNVKDLSNNKSDITHNHDARYIPAYSPDVPSTQNVRGQVWIEIEN